jgi:hypothetical protein
MMIETCIRFLLESKNYFLFSFPIGQKIDLYDTMKLWRV